MRIASAIIAVPTLFLAACSSTPKDQVAEDIAWAKAVKPMLQDYAIIQQQERYRQAQNYAFERQLNRAEEAKIPYTGVVRYPEDWPEITAKRDRAARQDQRQIQ